MRQQRIVTSEMGSWKWQNAYRIATYEARAGVDGVLRWWSVGRSGKYSDPQLRRYGYSDRLMWGGIHRKALTVEEQADWRIGRMQEIGVLR